MTITTTITTPAVVRVAARMRLGHRRDRTSGYPPSTLSSYLTRRHDGFHSKKTTRMTTGTRVTKIGIRSFLIVEDVWVTSTPDAVVEVSFPTRSFRLWTIES